MEKSRKIRKEWSMSVPWGKLAGISWGSQSNPPVLMVHGKLDSAATFIPLAELLPDNFFYLALDLPGHGDSDPLPYGIPISIGHQVETIRQVVKHMKWKTFITISHSLGIHISCLYNAAFPNKIIKMVNLDPELILCIMSIATGTFPLWNYNFYEYYYSNMANSKNQPELTYEEALEMIQRGRRVNRDDAEILLSRNLEHTSRGKYRFKWDLSAKKPVVIPFDGETVCSLWALNAPPMFNTISSISYEGVDKYMEKLEKNIPVFIKVHYTGDHDHHVTQPSDYASEISDFLNTDYIKSKL
ncbi:unnamed protein product [Colias eurytheme]|nr:unnamed protein product [Colias eurytheme]